MSIFCGANKLANKELHTNRHMENTVAYIRVSVSYTQSGRSISWRYTLDGGLLQDSFHSHYTAFMAFY